MKNKKKTAMPKDIPNKNLLLKHARGEGVNFKNIKHRIFQKRIENKEKKIEFAADVAARTEYLLPEEAGYLQAGDYEETTECTQKEIRDASDITSATKHFELDLQFGPYRLDYTSNGRHLLLGGERGHVAAFDWVTKQLMCEINVMESVHDVKWLHIETLFAVAQKSHLFIYDNQGTEIHCIRQLHRLLRLEFLPYHFLLATSSERGHLAWLDVCTGKLVGNFNAKMGRLSHMTQNPYNATVVLGHPTGVVTLWSPTVREPLAKLLCHKTAIQALHVDPTGRYLATSAMDRSVNIWDIRALKPLQSYKMQGVPSTIKLSSRGCMAVGTGNIIQVYRDCILTPADTQYLTYRGNSGRVSHLQYCPFEDVLGAGTQRGFCSLIVPGSGEPNFDSMEQNPFRTKQQRREGEVKSLLEKIQPELITLEPQDIAEVDLPSLHDKIQAQAALMVMKTPKINYQPRRKNKKGGGLQASKAKKILQEEATKKFVKMSKHSKMGNKLLAAEDDGTEQMLGPKSVLDRFKPKKSQKKKK